MRNFVPSFPAGNGKPVAGPDREVSYRGCTGVDNPGLPASRNRRIRRNPDRQRAPRKPCWCFDCGTSHEIRPGVRLRETGSVVRFAFFGEGDRFTPIRMCRNPLEQASSLLPTLRPRFFSDGRLSPPVLRRASRPTGRENEKGRPISQIEWIFTSYTVIVLSFTHPLSTTPATFFDRKRTGTFRDASQKCGGFPAFSPR